MANKSRKTIFKNQARIECDCGYSFNIWWHEDWNDCSCQCGKEYNCKKKGDKIIVIHGQAYRKSYELTEFLRKYRKEHKTLLFG